MPDDDNGILKEIGLFSRNRPAWGKVGRVQRMNRRITEANQRKAPRRGLSALMKALGDNNKLEMRSSQRILLFYHHPPSPPRPPPKGH